MGQAFRRQPATGPQDQPKDRALGRSQVGRTPGSAEAADAGSVCRGAQDQSDGQLAASLFVAQPPCTCGSFWDIIGATYEKTTFAFASGPAVRCRSGGILRVEVGGLKVHKGVREAGRFRQSQRASDVPR